MLPLSSRGARGGSGGGTGTGCVRVLLRFPEDVTLQFKTDTYQA